ncbi:MAG: DUF2188 domain-containing protein [Candidatus Cloacimonetes bacterium]|jgi:hypothetical protein|nr:DUF2188 domain-containing protein [Candidatus Cloacimonadota bacterium]MDY0172344.1 DUF2188 domain-containing protein [Candidatus Cloacimonadaceae bacterium]
MAYKEYHVTKNTSVWKVKEANAERAVKIFETKQGALHYGRALAQNQKAELVIHKADGKIQDKRSFGNDPCPPKDKK